MSSSETAKQAKQETELGACESYNVALDRMFKTKLRCGKQEGRSVPIDLWEYIISESEISYLLKSKTMKNRLLEAMHRKEGIPFDEVREKLGI